MVNRRMTTSRKTSSRPRLAALLFRLGRGARSLLRARWPDGVTMRQIRAIDLAPGRPLVICDVDEVTLHFIRGFEAWLAEQDLYLAPDSWSIEGNVRRMKDGKALSTPVVRALVERFFKERIHDLDPIAGAAESLADLEQAGAQIVLLTNLPHAYHEPRRRNLLRHGFPWPLVTNSGPKGPAVRALAAKAQAPCAFIDDHAEFLESAGRHVPSAGLVHFLHDARFARHAACPAHPHVRVHDWRAAHAHVSHLLGRPQKVARQARPAARR